MLKSQTVTGVYADFYKMPKKILPSINRDVINFLKTQKAYTVHRVTNKKILHRRVLAPKPGIITSCDLADISSLARYNNGIQIHSRLC